MDGLLWLDLLLLLSLMLSVVVYFSLVSSDSDQTLFQILRSKTMNENAERINGWAAMIGVIAAMGSYAVTGQLIPGIW